MSTPPARSTPSRVSGSILIPAVKDAFIRSVDLDAGRMNVKVWEGM